MSDHLELVGYLLGSVRFLALFLVAPFFGHPAIPPRLRMGFALAVAGALGTLGVDPVQPVGPAGAGMATALLGEVLLGFTLGFATRLVFAGFSLMGEVISVQGGLGAASVLDPASDASTPAMASLTNLFAILVMSALGGDHAILRATAGSIAQIPIGSVSVDGNLLGAIAGLGFVIFDVAVRLAMPVTAAMLLANLAVGILGRTIPQLNLMTVQLPALLALTFLLLVLGSDAFIGAIGRSIEEWIGGVGRLVVGAV
ncbi:MAG: flagellar biosynthetic protein FliR [Myxococcota bacterium]